MNPIGAKGDRILVIVVTYEATPWLATCLAPFALDREGIDILVIDNASGDGTPQAVRTRFPFVLLEERPTNLGFGKANNIGIEKAIAEEYRGVFLLNQDATISPTAIRTLADRVEKDPSIGIASPLHFSDTTYSTVERGFRHYVPDVEKHLRSGGQEFVSVPFVNAALWYIPLSTLCAIGLFSPLFKHYGEDLDYVHRTLYAGLRIGFFPDLKGAHLRPDSPLPPEKRQILDSAWRLARLLDPHYSLTSGVIEAISKPLIFSVTKSDTSYLKTARELLRLLPEVRLWRNRPPIDLEGLKRTQSRTTFAPVLLLVYNRPHHVARLLEDFFSNTEATHTPLFIIQDGGEGKAWEEVSTLCTEMERRHDFVTFIRRDGHLGLAGNVTRSVSELFRTYDRLIVLEDDLRLSPYFLRWMNDALDLYKDISEVAHLHAGTFYYRPGLRNNHLLHFAGSWGWATWRDRWQELWDADGLRLLRSLDAQPEKKEHFDYGGFQKFSRMLRRQTLGENDSWAIRWHASLLLSNKLSLNASPPLVTNCGFDGSGVHSPGDDRYHTPVAPYPIYGEKREPVEDAEAYEILKDYYTVHNNKVAKGLYKLKELWRKYFR